MSNLPLTALAVILWNSMASSASSQSAEEFSMFDAFKALCTPDIRDAEAAKDRALAYGWELTDKTVSPRLKAQVDFLKFNRMFGNSETEGEFFKFKIKSKTIYGRLFETTANGVRFCQVRDFHAKSSNLGSAVRSWLGQEPTNVFDNQYGISEEWYRPGKFKQYLRVNSGFYPTTKSNEHMGSVGALLAVSQADPSRDKF